MYNFNSFMNCSVHGHKPTTFASQTECPCGREKGSNVNCMPRVFPISTQLSPSSGSGHFGHRSSRGTNQAGTWTPEWKTQTSTYPLSRTRCAFPLQPNKLCPGRTGIKNWTPSATFNSPTIVRVLKNESHFLSVLGKIISKF